MNKKEHKLLIATALALLPSYSQRNQDVIHNEAASLTASKSGRFRVAFAGLMLRMWQGAELGRAWAEACRPPRPYPRATGTRLEKWLTRQAFLVGWHSYHNERVRAGSGAVFAEVLDPLLAEGDRSA